MKKGAQISSSGKVRNSGGARRRVWPRASLEMEVQTLRRDLEKLMEERRCEQEQARKAFAQLREREAARRRAKAAIGWGIAGSLGLLFAHKLAAGVAGLDGPDSGVLEAYLSYGLRLLSALVCVVPAVRWVAHSSCCQEVKALVVMLISAALLKGSNLLSKETVGHLADVLGFTGAFSMPLLAYFLRNRHARH